MIASGTFSKVVVKINTMATFGYGSELEVQFDKNSSGLHKPEDTVSVVHLGLGVRLEPRNSAPVDGREREIAANCMLCARCKKQAC